MFIIEYILGPWTMDRFLGCFAMFGNFHFLIFFTHFHWYSEGFWTVIGMAFMVVIVFFTFTFYGKAKCEKSGEGQYKAISFNRLYNFINIVTRRQQAYSANTYQEQMAWMHGYCTPDILLHFSKKNFVTLQDWLLSTRFIMSQVLCCWFLLFFLKVWFMI